MLQALDFVLSFLKLCLKGTKHIEFKISNRIICSDWKITWLKLYYFPLGKESNLGQLAAFHLSSALEAQHSGIWPRKGLWMYSYRRSYLAGDNQEHNSRLTLGILYDSFILKYRLLSCGGNWYRPLNSHATLLDKYWTKIHLDNMDKTELNEVYWCFFFFNFLLLKLQTYM